MRVQVDAGLPAALFDHPGHTVAGHRPLRAQPQRITVGVAVAGAGAQVAVQRPRGLPPERGAAGLAAFAEHDDHLGVEVDAVDGQPGDLGQPRTGVEEHAQQRGVAAGDEVGACTRRQQRLHLRVGEHRRLLVGHPRLLHPLHRVRVDLALGDAPPEELLQRPEPRRDGGGLVPFGLVGEERPHGLAVQFGKGVPPECSRSRASASR